MRIATAELDDEIPAVALWEACGLTRPWNDPPAEFRMAFASDHSTVLVAREGETLVGTVLVGDDGHRGWLYYLAVDAAVRRRGLGAALVGAAEQWLQDRGQDRVRLMVRGENTQVLGFYAALGYGDQDCVVLGRRLDGAGH